jgi:hypothetical protein
MNLDRNVVARELPVLLLNHLHILVFKLVQKCVQVFLISPHLELLFLILITLFLLMDLDQRVFDKLNFGHQHVHRSFQTSHFQILV